MGHFSAILLLLLFSSASYGQSAVGIGMARDCLKPFELTVSIKNNTQEEMIFGRGALPWEMGSRTLELSVLSIDDGELSILASGTAIGDHLDYVKIPPGGRISGVVDLRSRVPEIGKVIKDNHVLVSFHGNLRSRERVTLGKWKGIYFIPKGKSQSCAALRYSVEKLAMPSTSSTK